MSDFSDIADFISGFNSLIIFILYCMATVSFVHIRYKASVRRSILDEMITDLRLKSSKELEGCLRQVEQERLVKINALQKIIEGDW
jgi:hypothetical protein